MYEAFYLHCTPDQNYNPWETSFASTGIYCVLGNSYHKETIVATNILYYHVLVLCASCKDNEYWQKLVLLDKMYHLVQGALF